MSDETKFRVCLALLAGILLLMAVLVFLKRVQGA